MSVNDRSVLAYLETTGIIDAIESREKDLGHVKSEIQNFLDSAGKSYLCSPNRSKAQRMMEHRRRVKDTAEALSSLYASLADEDEDAIAFRSECCAKH